MMKVVFDEETVARCMRRPDGLLFLLADDMLFVADDRLFVEIFSKKEKSSRIDCPKGGGTESCCFPGAWKRKLPGHSCSWPCYAKRQYFVVIMLNASGRAVKKLTKCFDGHPADENTPQTADSPYESGQ